MILDVNETFPITAVSLPATHALRLCDPSKIFHDAQMKRHPLAAYNLSISAVLARFNTVLNALKTLDIDCSSELTVSPVGEVRLLEATDHLLNSLMEHMEACEKIVASFFEDPDCKPNKKKIESYKKKVNPYRAFIGNIDNFIKHQQGRARLITFYDQECIYPGYYIEGVVEPGVVGPAPGIHPNGNSAFSYARDLRFHMVNILGVSKHLANFSESTKIPSESSTSPTDIPALQTEPLLLELLTKISNTAPIFFPDEMEKPLPGISISPREVMVKFPDNSTPKCSFPGDMRVVSSLASDGVTRKYKLPYFGNGNA